MSLKLAQFLLGLTFAISICLCFSFGQENVFSAGEGGYYCIRIPSLVATLNGSLLAFGEGRMGNCNDAGWVDVVMKRSTDGGVTWSDLVVLETNSSSTDHNTIDSPTPVQDLQTGTIFLVFCRNDQEVHITNSTDDGVTWSTPTNLTPILPTSWKWLTTGPPAGLQLSSGRLLIPGYNMLPNATSILYAEDYLIYSDDHGLTWQLGASIQSPHYPGECQAVDLGNNTVLLNSRTPSTSRLQSISYDGGLSFSTPYIIEDLPEPDNGCEGSMIGTAELLFFSNPMSTSRINMTLHTSIDQGASWQVNHVIDPSDSGYSSLARLQNGSVAILYEKGVLPSGAPAYLTFLVVWSPAL